MTTELTHGIIADPQEDPAGRAWAAREAAEVLKARVLGTAAQFGVSAYEVITLADWIDTGNLPDIGEVEAIESDAAEGSSSEQYHFPPLVDGVNDGILVRHMSPSKYQNAVNNLGKAFEYGGTNYQAKCQHADAFLAALGFRVEASA